MTYRRFNVIVLIGLLAALPLLLAVPWIQTQVGGFYPACMLERLAGRSCPMCGLTTGLLAILSAKRGALSSHPLALVVILLGLGELTARAMLLLRAPGPQHTARFIRTDLRLHAALAVAYLVYCILFFAL